jgi:tRNA(fMet)-specific endonuclease VapC
VSFLIDTDICSSYLRQRSQIVARFHQYLGRLRISVITLGELRTWALRRNSSPSRRTDLDDLLRIVTVVDVNQAVADRFGDLRAFQLDAGTPTPSLDLFIAATALIHQLVVVTHNTKHYASIPGLQLVDWLLP